MSHRPNLAQVLLADGCASSTGIGCFAEAVNAQAWQAAASVWSPSTASSSPRPCLRKTELDSQEVSTRP
jgi:hypothetical protein